MTVFATDGTSALPNEDVGFGVPGRRLIANILTAKARLEPDKTLFSISRSETDLSQGFRDISNTEYARAVDRAAWWLQRQFGSMETAKAELVERPSFAYFGPNDLRYTILATAASKVDGLRILLPAPRNPLAAQLALFQRANCRTVIHAASSRKMLQPLLDTLPDSLTTIVLPELDEYFLGDGEVETYPCSKTYEEGNREVSLILHTSGSSGNPKPLLLPQLTFAETDRYNILSQKEGRLSLPCYHKQRACVALPLFHAAGVGHCVFFPLYFNYVPVLLPSQRPFSADLIEQVLAEGNVSMLIAPPSILEELVASPTGLQRLRQARLKLIMYGGGPLAKSTGDILANIAPLTSFLGSTETGLFPTYLPPSEDWDAFRFHPDLHPKMDHIGGDTFELVIPQDGIFEAIFTHFPELSEYRTRDLYRPHSQRPGWWIYHGRVDDLIVLSNGEKVDPADMEAAVKRHPSVRDSLVVGQGRFQPALLVELRDNVTDTMERDVILQSVWEVVKDTNRLLPGQSRIAQQFITLTVPGRPFERSGKGSVQRQLTIQNYNDILDEMYSTAERISEDPSLGSLNETSTKEEIEGVVRAVIHGTFQHPELNDEIDLFTLGLDSLHVLECVRRLRGASRQLAGFAVNIVYANPTILRLSAAIADIIQGRGDSVTDHRSDSDRAAHMQRLVAKYSADLPHLSPGLDRFGANANELTVVLTGSTGSLGCHLLDYLVDIGGIRKIICLNRSAEGSLRQKQMSASRGLRTNWITAQGDERVTTSPAVEFWKTDFSRADLGLNETQLLDLTDATHFIHNAWHVNYNEHLESFEQTHIAGLRHLIDWVSKCHTRLVTFLFLSSIATVARWPINHNERVDDEIVDDYSVPACTGYAESKYVAERVVANAASAFGAAARFAVLRVGQVSGSMMMKHEVSAVNVVRWNKHEWFPSLVISSKHLGLLPASIPGMDRIDWIPVDSLTRVIVDLMLEPNAKGAYNIVNPATTTWATGVLPVLQRRLGIPASGIVPYPRWFAALESAATNVDSDANVLRDLPAVRLIDHFQEMQGFSELQFSIDALLRDSATARSMRGGDLNIVASDGQWLEGWMEEWGV